ncbi:MAG TPA: hydrogenase maturation nickel metallochaperone HypA [Solirubrobacteraceae bacterium]|nr:hydrogenase maturation nickel metallochaperone HypA [Solirubrobacteraceae bacterium]
MHELSLASAILAIVDEHADGRRVTQVEVRVGHLRQVVPDALAYSFELVAQGTPAEGAELVLQPVAAQGDCRACGARTRLTRFPLRCGTCGGLEIEIVSGEELCVESLEVIDAQPALEEAL